MFSTLEFGPWGVLVRKMHLSQNGREETTPGCLPVPEGNLRLNCHRKNGKGRGASACWRAGLPSSMGVPATQLHPWAQLFRKVGFWGLLFNTGPWVLGLTLSPSKNTKNSTARGVGAAVGWSPRGGGRGGPPAASPRGARSAAAR